jgi:hypothetical protein
MLRRTGEGLLCGTGLGDSGDVGGGFSLGFWAGVVVSGEGVEGLNRGGAGEFGDVVCAGLGEGEQGVDGAGGGGLVPPRDELAERDADGVGDLDGREVGMEIEREEFLSLVAGEFWFDGAVVGCSPGHTPILPRRRGRASAAWRITGRLRARPVTVVKIFSEGVEGEGAPT